MHHTKALLGAAIPTGSQLVSDRKFDASKASAVAPTAAHVPPGGLSPPGTWVLVTEDKKVDDPRALLSDASSVASLSRFALRAKAAKVRSTGSSFLPPPLNTTVDVTHKFRFVNTSASQAVVSFDTLRGALGGVATTTTAVQPWASSVRVHWVTVWPAPNASATDTVEMFWEAGTSDQVPDETRVQTLPEGVTVTRAVSFVPPPKSLASFWLSTAANVFGIRAPVGSVIDILVGFRLSNVFGAGPIVVASATAGNVYYLALDGASAHTYSPVGLPTTF